jgi:hypothetical protein
MYDQPMRVEDLESTIAKLVGAPIEAVMFWLGDGHPMMHDTALGEQWGHNMDKWPDPAFRRA